jgi:hypothetical protein
VLAFARSSRFFLSNQTVVGIMLMVASASSDDSLFSENDYCRENQFSCFEAEAKETIANRTVISNPCPAPPPQL